MNLICAKCEASKGEPHADCGDENCRCQSCIPSSQGQFRLMGDGETVGVDRPG